MRGRLVALACALGAALFGVLQVQAAAPVLEPMYVNGVIVNMSAPKGVPAGNSGAHAQDFYVIAYSFAPPGAPITTANGYHPLCDPCLFPGAPVPAYRETVLEGAPGFGTNGTAGSYNPLWHVFLVVPNPAWLADPNFVPARSTADLDAGEAAGHFLPINPGPGNPFELDTGINFLCVIVSSHA